MLTEFYIPLSAVCFTLLGLWLVVAAIRQAGWRGSSLHQRRAFAVATHFSLPGLAALLVLVNPGSGGLWRVSLGVAAGGGIVALIALRAPAAGKVGLAAYIAAMAAYVVIVILAIHPHIVGQLSFDNRAGAHRGRAADRCGVRGRERRLAPGVRERGTRFAARRVTRTTRGIARTAAEDDRPNRDGGGDVGVGDAGDRLPRDRRCVGGHPPLQVRDELLEVHGQARRDVGVAGDGEQGDA